MSTQKLIAAVAELQEVLLDMNRIAGNTVSESTKATLRATILLGKDTIRQLQEDINDVIEVPAHNAKRTRPTGNPFSNNPALGYIPRC